jgi:hypothetical protein
MLVVPTCQLGNPMVFLVLEVAGYGLLGGLLHGGFLVEALYFIPLLV